MKATMPVLVIAVGTKGHRSQKGGAPVSSCGCNGEEDNSPMIAVPIEALSVDSEDGKPVSPEVGDEVELPKVIGIVRKVDGDEAYVEIKEVGGMGVEYEDSKGESDGEGEPEDNGESMAEEEDKLRRMAMQEDRENGYA